MKILIFHMKTFIQSLDSSQCLVRPILQGDVCPEQMNIAFIFVGNNRKKGDFTVFLKKKEKKKKSEFYAYIFSVYCVDISPC